MLYKSFYPDPPSIPPTNAFHLLFNRPDQKAWSDYTLYIDGETGATVSFREQAERARDTATALSLPVSQGGLGLRAGSNAIIGILSENCLEYPLLIHALLYMTVPFALLSSHATVYELRHSIKLSQTTHIFCSASLYQLALETAKACEFPVERIFILHGHVQGIQHLGHMIAHVKEHNVSRLALCEAQKNTLAYLIFSSGTTGLPKAVAISHGNVSCVMLQNIVLALELMKIMPASSAPPPIPVYIGVLPLHHTYGLHTSTTRLMTTRATMVVLPKYDPATFLELIPRYRINILLLVPSMFLQLLNHPDFNKTDMSSVAYTGSGAAYLPPSVAEKWLSVVPSSLSMVSEALGMSECTLTVAMKPAPGVLNGRGKIKPGSAGLLYPGVEAKIIREDGSLAGPNEPGELWMRSESVALGYWNNEAATRATFVDGWLRTGDRIRIDEDGYLFFEDRTKDTLKVSGAQVSPTEIENVLLDQPDKLITEVCVAGVSGFGRTSDEMVPRAWIVLSDAGRARGAEQTMRILDAWVRKTLSKYKWLRGGIEVVEEIPTNATGKVLRRSLQERFEMQQKKVAAKL